MGDQSKLSVAFGDDAAVMEGLIQQEIDRATAAGAVDPTEVAKRVMSRTPKKVTERQMTRWVEQAITLMVAGKGAISSTELAAVTGLREDDAAQFVQEVVPRLKAFLIREGHLPPPVSIN